jgi:serine/threonine protein kinase/WD40 repeat protein
MPVTTPCPEAMVLRQLLLGELTPPDLESLSEHVLQCERCAGRLNGLRADDPLLQTLRGGDTTVTPPTPNALVFMERLERWLACVAEGATGALRDPLSEGLDTQATREPLAPGVCAPEVSALGALSPPRGPDELGRLGGYRVLKLLGEGGMGAVFLAEDTQLERPVALKVMLPALAAKRDARQRFLREAKAAAKLKDDHVVSIYQVGEDRGVPFLAMEYLHGESLESWLQRGKQLPVPEIVRLARDIARGLAAAHAKGLVHRDVKPANLWLESVVRGSELRLPPGGMDDRARTTDARVKILDFGLARGGVDEVQLTQSGTILGTPAYMAPEQGRGEPADARSDLFSLGCVLYRLCTGQAPFQGPTVMAVLTALATKDPRPVREVNPLIPEALAALVMRLLAKESKDRPASAQAVLHELQAVERQLAEESRTLALPVAAAETPEQAAKPPETKHVQSQPRRPRRWPLIAAGLLGIAGMVVLGGVVIRITSNDGKQTEIHVPDGSTVTVNPKGEVDVKLPGAGEKAVTAPPAGPPIFAGPSPLDKLDPAQIPPSERFAWQPKQLVAVLGEHRQRHWGMAQAAAVSRDGKRIATSGTDGMVRFWDAATCTEQGSVRVGPPGEYTTALAFAPDGKRLAFSGTSTPVGFLDLSGATPVREKMKLETKGEIPWRLTFTPDGKRLIGWVYDGQLVIWELSGGEAKVWLERPTRGSGLTKFSLSKDGRILACCLADKKVTLLDISAAEVREHLVVPQPNAVSGLDLSADGKRLAVASQDGKVRLWDVSGKTPAARGVFESGGVMVMRYSPNGKRLATASQSIRLWNVERPEPAGGEPFWGSLTANVVSDLAFTPDGKTLVVTGSDATVRFWDISGDRPQERNPIEPSSYVMGFPGNAGILPLVFSKDSKRLATLQSYSTRWWDLNGTAPVQLGLMQQRVPLAVSPDGKTLLLGSSWCDLTADVPRAGESYEKGELASATVTRLLPDDKTLVFGTHTGEIRIMERAAPKTLTERGRFNAGDGPVYHLEVSPDGRTLASVISGTVKLWDLAGQKPTLRDTLPYKQVQRLAFSPDSRMLAVSADAITTVWDVHERQAKQLSKWERFWEEGPANCVAFSPNSRTLASATARGKLTVRDAESGAIRQEWQLPGPISWVAYAPDGRHLLTVNSNGTGYILRLTTPDGRPYAPPMPAAAHQ